MPAIFNNWFVFSSTSHNYETSFATKDHLKISTVTKKTCGKGSFVSMTTMTWNNIKIGIKDPMMNPFSPKELKLRFICYLSLYQT